MPSGTPAQWTRELVERLENADEREIRQLSEELGIARTTLYSVRKRVAEFGSIDAFLARNTNTGSRKPRPKRPQTLKEELTKSYVIRGKGNAGRGFTTQYTVTVPKRMAELFLERFGSTEIRFIPIEDGIKIVPVFGFALEDLPGWIPVEALEEGNDA